MSEQAFKGTVKEGFERRFTVINEKDFQKYVPEPVQEDFRISFNNVAAWIEDGRMQEGKQPYNSYVVINLDEPYIDEIIEIMKKHGHWGEGSLPFAAKLDLLNSMPFIDEDCGGGELVYVHVEYNQENLDKLAQVVPDLDEYLKGPGDPDGTKEYIDISYAAFQYAGADYYHKGKFVILTKDELIEMYMEEQSKRVKAEQELKNFKTLVNRTKADIKKSLKWIG